jgi:cytolysin-activating lysine-acyltransferase
MLLGEIALLLVHSDLHRPYNLADLALWFLQPIELEQCRLYRRGEALVGCVTWAWLDAPREARFLAGDAVLEADDWCAGDRLVVVDLVAPFGGVAAIVRDLRRHVFAGRSGRVTRRRADGSVKRVVRYPAVDANGRRLAGATCEPAHKAALSPAPSLARTA